MGFGVIDSDTAEQIIWLFILLFIPFLISPLSLPHFCYSFVTGICVIVF